jgi:hypothetical protein
MKGQHQRPRVLYEGNSSRPLARLPQPRQEKLYVVYESVPGAPGEVPERTALGAFLDRDSAEAHRDELAQELDERADAPVFEASALEELTSLEPAPLHDWMLDLGLCPPPLEECQSPSTWAFWWYECCNSMAGWQRVRVRQAFDRAPRRAFTVVEIDLIIEPGPARALLPALA